MIKKTAEGFFVSAAAAIAFALLAWVVLVVTFRTLRQQQKAVPQ